MTTNYRSDVLRTLAKGRRMNFKHNFDKANLGEEPAAPPSVWATGLAETRLQFERTLGEPFRKRMKSLSPLTRAAQYYVQPAQYFSRQHAEDIARGEFLYGLLADQRSRGLLVKLIAYKILGHRKIKLPRNTPGYWRDIDAMNKLKTSAPAFPIKFMDAKLAVYDLRPLGYEVTCHATQAGLACTVVQKQYEYHCADVHCKAEAGDVVIDAGGCWGETSLYFANEAGSAGAVVSFEFLPSNLAVLRRNLELNPHLTPHLHLVEQPIWNTSGLKLYYVDWGPGSRVTHDVNKYPNVDGTVETTTIDETLSRLGLSRVDYIKMDIEGAELNALRGAEGSIRQHRPKLAISLYHNPDDFNVIPRYLAGLDLGYRFYLDHHTIYENETVLFAVPGP